MTAVLLTPGPNVATGAIEAESTTFKISVDTLPRRTSDVSRPRGTSLPAVAVGEPSIPRKQLAPVDASFLTINRPIAQVIASQALRQQVDDRHAPSGNDLDAGKIYAPLILGSRISADFDPVRDRISMNVPGASGASTEVRVQLSADGKSVVGMEKYEWSEQDLGPDLSDVLADHVLPGHVLNKDLEVHKNLLDGNVHSKNVEGIQMTLWYDAGLHQLRIAGLDPEGSEVRLALAPDRTTLDGGHKCSCSGPQHVPTETLGKLVDAGLLADELLDVRLAASPHSPGAASPEFFSEAPIIVTPEKLDTRRSVDRVPSPINNSRSPLGLALTDVIANTALRNQVHRDRSSKDLDLSEERHRYTDRMANGETIESWYEVRHGLIWITVGSAKDAPCVRIRLSPDRKTVLRIDEPIARLPVASKEALTSLVAAGVIQPQALYSLHPDPQDPAKLQSPDPRVRLKAALGMAMYRTASPESETQRLRVDQWTETLLWNLEVPYRTDENGEEVVPGAATIDLRDMYTKSQIDVLTEIGPVGWNALFDIARENGATELRPLVRGRAAATLINAVKSAVPQIEHAIVAAGDSIDGKIEVDLEELDESAPAISIRIEGARAGDSLDVYASPWPSSVTVQPVPKWETPVSEQKMKLWRRERDGEVRKSEDLRYAAKRFR